MRTSKSDIVISNGKMDGSTKQIYSCDDFFNCDEIVVKVAYNCIKFTKPTMDYIGKTHHPRINDNGYIRNGGKKNNIRSRFFHITADLPIGSYNFDEYESTNDIKVVYF